MKKLLVVGVIVLFLGLAIAPSINANVSKISIDNELVEFTTEVCGLNGGKHTVQLTKAEAKIYFVIGIGMYMEGGTWPVYDEICPIFLIRFGKNPHILTPKCGERINFIRGDKFIGYYPFLNPIGIGFVCGIWIDI